MFLCRSGRHHWADPVDAKCCCNGMERCLAVETPSAAGIGFADIAFIRYWRMVSPSDYDPDYVPVEVGTVKLEVK